jgi:hypothetical protein
MPVIEIGRSGGKLPIIDCHDSAIFKFYIPLRGGLVSISLERLSQ